jgi:cell division protein FtsN
MMTFSLSKHSRQSGNTLTGLIIGLVVGLAIAVVVALAITKGSTPFTDKSGKLGKPAEPTAGQISDPNKPLYGGKDAAREANKEFQKAAPAVPDAAAVVAAVKMPAAVAPKTDGAKPAELPAKVVPATGAPAAAAGADDKYVYYLQVGEFREASNADNTRAKLALLGFEASVSERTVDNNVLHRVRLGPYAQVEAMNKVRSKLTENGVDVAVVRNQK